MEKCAWCGDPFKPKQDENVCPICEKDLDEIEARESQEFFKNLDNIQGDFFNLDVSQKRDILGANY